MPVPAIVMFKIQLRENRHWVDLCGCDGCGVVCFEGYLCSCAGHIDKRKRSDEEFANHSRVARVADVVEMLRLQQRRGVA
jgi:pyruvate formate-lyase activating enzyme-like uncharacterized protein